MAGNPYITTKLFTFFRDLKKHNTREWFEENKDRYERDVRVPLLDFIEDFAEHLDQISPHFEADNRKVGGSLFRIYRDVRFSKDKSPYKTHAGIQFRHESARDVHAPGFYLHLEPGACFIGAGIWHPDRDTLTRIRNTIVDDPDGWQKVVGDARFKRQYKLDGDSLKRAPAGFNPAHPLIEDLKRKDFVAGCDTTEKAACAPGYMASLGRIYKTAGPFVRFLTEAVGLPF